MSPAILCVPDDSRLFGRLLQSCTCPVLSFHTSVCRACDRRRNPCSPRPCQRPSPEALADWWVSLRRARSRKLPEWPLAEQLLILPELSRVPLLLALSPR